MFNTVSIDKFEFTTDVYFDFSEYFKKNKNNIKQKNRRKILNNNNELIQSLQNELLNTLLFHYKNEIFRSRYDNKSVIRGLQSKTTII